MNTAQVPVWSVRHVSQRVAIAHVIGVRSRRVNARMIRDLLIVRLGQAVNVTELPNDGACACASLRTYEVRFSGCTIEGQAPLTGPQIVAAWDAIIEQVEAAEYSRDLLKLVEVE